MADLYTELKLAIQQQFKVGTLASYSGQRKQLHGSVKVIGHEKKGGIVIEADGIVATVSPFSLLPVATVRPPRTRGTQPEPQNGHTPTARIFRNGVPVVPESPKKPTVKVTTPDEADALARLKAIGQPSTGTTDGKTVPAATPRVTPPPITPPLGKANVEAFFFKWLRDWRRDTPQPSRQSLIDHFNLPVYLRDRVPVEPGLFHYKQCIYFIAAAMLADPSRVPPLADIQVTVSSRFRVSEEAVAVHLKWMRKRLEVDHATFVAQRATVGVTP